MGLVLGQDRPQVPLTEDRYPVCELRHSQASPSARASLLPQSRYPASGSGVAGALCRFLAVGFLSFRITFGIPGVRQDLIVVREGIFRRQFGQVQGEGNFSASR